MARAHHEGRPAGPGPDPCGHQNPSVDEGPGGLCAEIENHTVRRDERGRDEGRSQEESRPVHPVTPGLRSPFVFLPLRLGHAMTVCSDERLPYLTVRVTNGHGRLLDQSTNVLSRKHGLVPRDLVCTGRPVPHLKSGGNRSGIPSLISYRWLQCLQKSEPSRISSFSTSTRSSRSPLHTGQHRISMRSRFIDRRKVGVRLKPIAREPSGSVPKDSWRGPASGGPRPPVDSRQSLYRRSIMGAISRRFVEAWTIGKACSAPTGGPPPSSC